MRGLFVGAASGAVAIAAHALGGGAVSPDRSSITLLIAACAVVGTAIASTRVRRGASELAVLLAAGQTIGHLAMTMSPEHHHGPHMTAHMLVAHLIAIPSGAVLIRAAELAIARAASSVRRTLSVLYTVPLVATRLPLVRAARLAPGARWFLVGSGVGTRGPPTFA